ncbi:murein hydrolase activator EnvC family protein [Sinanaerobacter sp. ZZT-01]|uniref:murein hydrolase activator EnvC family protein n=1 Tax=Sinanaerobacter sp. ZZT-01 TaxID=3111540 RepID=UPI002D770B52|nr:peptidoglycan DD-metalloendopeptidase family protein [Sinanaerobacter sp. ZZT-01]WRR93492.1 peptidoglycan DD-metalloendopeptidase family protein [Sinanaerobacter sp. ZZT-01]
MKKSRFVSYTLIAVLVCSIWTLHLGYAVTDSEKLNNVNSQINQTQKQLNEGKKKVNALNTEITNLENKINAAETEIANLQGDIGKTKQTILETQNTLNQLKSEMDEQNTNMNSRLRAMYKNGDVDILGILLGSSDISEFMTNMDMVQKIYDNDIQVLESMEQRYEKIDLQQKRLVALNEQLLSQQTVAQDKQDALEANRGAVVEKKAEVLKDNKALTAQIDTLNAEADALVSKIRALQDDSAVYAGGVLAWPVPGHTRITSPFGYRLHPVLKVNKLHTGIDISAGTGTKVIAAADGKVIMSGWNNSYGNVVMIDHGSGIVTVYAHNSKLLVSVGTAVTRGQQIASSGSTGMSTGPHVHFEVRLNGAYKNPKDYL